MINSENSRGLLSPPAGTVAVTLTMTDSAAENVKGVVKSLCGLLCVAEPTSYQVGGGEVRKELATSGRKREARPSTDSSVSDRSQSTVNSTVDSQQQQLALSGKQQRFCKHCDVVILGEGVLKYTGDPANPKVIFCSSDCYMQFSISQRSQGPALAHQEPAAGAVVNHLSSEPTSPVLKTPTSSSATSAASSSTSAVAISLPAIMPLGAVSTSAAGEALSKVTLTTSATSVTSVTQPVAAQLPPTISIPPEVKGDMEVSSGKPSKLVIRRKASSLDDSGPPAPKKWKNLRWKKWTVSIVTHKKYRPPSEQDIDELMKRLGTSLRPDSKYRDSRACLLCGGQGDGETDGPARLLNVDVDTWVHLNCALWSSEVYETVNGALINVDMAIRRAKGVSCCYCSKFGATVCCHKFRCSNVYHFGCAIHDHCMFFKDKTMLCPLHAPSKASDSALQRSHIVYRRVYISRDENKQVASIMQQLDRKHTFRVGSLVFHSLGQLLPHQMQAFHSENAIHPVGFETTRLYWSMRFTNKRCSYTCSIHDNGGKPLFIIRVVEQGHEDIVLQDCSPKAVWSKVLEPIAKLRRDADMLKLFPMFLTGEELYGLTEPAIQRVIESLPGVELIQSYSFRFGRSPYIELPLAINPTGCARTEPKMRTRLKRPHTLTSNTTSRAFQTTLSGEFVSPYNKQFFHSKSSQYRRLKTEWKTNVYLARSNIQGLGLFATRDIEKHTMVIEYIGRLIRNEVANRLERVYQRGNHGIYMFRIDNDTVVDATMSGNPARYINHSCNPNCVAEVVSFDKELKIIIISNRRLSKGEELTYDYKFDIEDENRIPCLCGAPNCKKWMN